MVRIALCDGGNLWNGQMECFLNQYQEARQEQLFEIEQFSDGTLLLASLQVTVFDLVFLDIAMKGMDGKEVARRVRQKGIPVDIVFVSCQGGQWQVGYEFRALGFIVAPPKFSDIRTLMDRVLAEKDQIPYTVHSKKGTAVIWLRDIVYMMVSHYEIRLQGLSGKEQWFHTGSLNEIEKRIGDKGFVRVHRSYLINLEHVLVCCRNGNVILRGGHEVPVGRQYEETYQTAYDSYQLKKRKGILL